MKKNQFVLCLLHCQFRLAVSSYYFIDALTIFFFVLSDVTHCSLMKDSDFTTLVAETGGKIEKMSAICKITSVAS